MFETTSQNSMDRIKAWLSTCHVMRPSLRQGSHHFLATQSFTGVSTHIFRGGWWSMGSPNGSPSDHGFQYKNCEKRLVDDWGYPLPLGNLHICWFQSPFCKASRKVVTTDAHSSDACSLKHRKKHVFNWLNPKPHRLKRPLRKHFLRQYLIPSGNLT